MIARKYPARFLDLVRGLCIPQYRDSFFYADIFCGRLPPCAILLVSLGWWFCGAAPNPRAGPAVAFGIGSARGRIQFNGMIMDLLGTSDLFSILLVSHKKRTASGVGGGAEDSREIVGKRNPQCSCLLSSIIRPEHTETCFKHTKSMLQCGKQIIRTLAESLSAFHASNTYTDRINLLVSKGAPTKGTLLAQPRRQSYRLSLAPRQSRQERIAVLSRRPWQARRVQRRQTTRPRWGPFGATKAVRAPSYRGNARCAGAHTNGLSASRTTRGTASRVVYGA